MVGHKSGNIDLQQARLDPGSVFGGPEEVVEAPDLTAEQKRDILRRWEYDARGLAVAEEEGMGGGEASVLDRIEAALRALGERGP